MVQEKIAFHIKVKSVESCVLNGYGNVFFCALKKKRKVIQTIAAFRDFPDKVHFADKELHIASKDTPKSLQYSFMVLDVNNRVILRGNLDLSQIKISTQPVHIVVSLVPLKESTLTATNHFSFLSVTAQRVPSNNTCSVISLDRSLSRTSSENTETSLLRRKQSHRQLSLDITSDSSPVPIERP